MDQHPLADAPAPSQPLIPHSVADPSHQSAPVVAVCEWGGGQQDGVIAMESPQMISVPASAQNSQESDFNQEKGGKDQSRVDVEGMQPDIRCASFPNPHSSVASEKLGMLQAGERKEQTMGLASGYELKPSYSEQSTLNLSDPKVVVREENAVNESGNYEYSVQTSNFVYAEEQDLVNPPCGLNCPVKGSAENISGMDIGVENGCGPPSTATEFSCLAAGELHNEIIPNSGETVEGFGKMAETIEPYKLGGNFGVESDCGTMGLAEVSEQAVNSPNRNLLAVTSTPTTLQEASKCVGVLDTVQCSDALSARKLENVGNSGCYSPLGGYGEDSELEQKASPDDVSELLKDGEEGKATLKSCSSQQIEDASEYYGKGSEIGPRKQLEPRAFVNEQEIGYTECGTDEVELHGEAVANPHLMGLRPEVEDIDNTEFLKDVEVEGMFMGAGKNSSSIGISNKSLSEDKQSIVAEGENLENAAAEDVSLRLGMNDDTLDDQHAMENVQNSFFVKKENDEHISSVDLREECSERGPIGYNRSRKHISQQALNGENEELVFRVGDLVWAKVKSHPWWPGQIFDPVDASSLAKKVQKPGRVLVAFFGDSTFGWLHQSQLIAFHPNFIEKVKQTTMKSFCRAVAEALDEVCRRVELGWSCACHGDESYSAVTFPDGNNGIQTGGRIKVHKDISSSNESFMPSRTYKFIMDVASSPLSFWNFTLQDAELRGQAYAFRASILGLGKPSHLRRLQQIQEATMECPPQIPRRNLRRKFSALEGDSCDFVQGDIDVKNGSLLIDASSSKKGRASKKSRSMIEGDLIKTPTSNSSLKKKMRTLSDFKERGKVRKEVQNQIRKGKRVASQATGREKKNKRFYRSPVEGRLLKSMPVGKGDFSLTSDEYDDSATLLGSGSHRRRSKHKNRHMKEQLSNHRIVKKKEMSSPDLEQVESSKKNIKTLKVGECIQRIASELTGTPFMKRLDRAVAKRSFPASGRKSVPKRNKGGVAVGSTGRKKHKKFVFSDFAAEEPVSAFAPFLRELLALAKDPFTNKILKKPLEVRDMVLKFRGMAFQKSAGLSPSLLSRSVGRRGKAGVHHANAKQGAPVRELRYKSEDIVHSDHRKDVKVYISKRKRRLEGQQKNQVKKFKKGVGGTVALVSRMS